MKTTIRKKVFETNSSSEHVFTVTITSEDLYDKFLCNKVRWFPTEEKILNEEETKNIENNFKYAFIVLLRAFLEGYEDGKARTNRFDFLDFDSSVLYNKFINFDGRCGIDRSGALNREKQNIINSLKKEIGVSSDDDNLFFEINDDSAETFVKYLKMKGIFSDENKFIDFVDTVGRQLEFVEDNCYSPFNSLTSDFGSENFISDFLDVLFPKFEVYQQLFSQSEGSFEQTKTIGNEKIVSFGSYYEKDC